MKMFFLNRNVLKNKFKFQKKVWFLSLIEIIYKELVLKRIDAMESKKKF